jgi:16S rRNA (adenine1518-N6/adenine1519-N6)-dimethyltransferase
MNLSSKKTIRELLSSHGMAPLKGLGQNFLIDRHAVSKLIGAAAITSDDTVLEIGPGIGTLTQELAQKAKKVIAIEKDKKMIEVLQETLAEYENIRIIHGDALDTKYKIQDTNLSPTFLTT